jgi:hypothetical protein
MKFYSDVPNLHIIRDRQLGFNGRSERYLLCKFDENGEFESDDPEVIRQLRNIYRHDETVEQQDDKPKTMKCKKCSFETENKGELLAHYRKDHKKGV